MIEEGTMVEITAEDHAEKLKGIVGVVVEKLVPDEKTNETGEVTVYRVEFFTHRHLLPDNIPRYWPAGDLKEAK